MKNLILIFISLISFADVIGQSPQINNIAKNSTYPGDTILISGSNFSANPADLSVWFGAVEGTIISSSTTMVEVRVPEEASFERIYVTNHSTGLSAYTNVRFFPSYSGDASFDATEFSSPLIFNSTGSEKEFYDLCACDLDGDGKPEIAATKFDNATDLVVLHNNSTPENISFNLLSSAQVPNLGVGAPTLNIVCNDLNGDGKPELIASRSGVTRNNVFVLQNNSTAGNISFASRLMMVMPVEIKSRRLKIADLNFDGRPEIIVTDVNSNVLQVFVNNSSKTTVSFEATPVPVIVAGADNTSGIEVQDLNGDKKPDLIVTQFFKDNVFILPNTSTSSQISFGNSQVLNKMGVPLLNVKTGDLNGDGMPEIMATNTSSNQLVIFPNTSTSTISFGTSQNFTVGGGPWGIDLADMNGDGRPDILIGNQNLQQINILINNSTTGSLSFSREDVSTDLNVRNVLGNDFDGDGKPDIAFTSFTGTNGPFRIQIIRNLNCYDPVFLNKNDPVSICSGQSPQLKVVPNALATYNWYKDGDPTPLKSGIESYLTVTESGSYTVEAVTESGACTLSNTIQVVDASGSVPSDPAPVSNGTICEGEAINLSVPEVTNASYSWSGPNGYTSTDREPVISDASPGNSGEYSVIIRVGDCQSNEASVVVDVISLPVFSLASQLNQGFCEGTVNELSVTSRAGYSYQWYHNNNIINGESGLTYNATTSGDYHVLVTDNNSGCSITTETLSLSTYSNPVAAFTVSSDAACTDEIITLMNNSTYDQNGEVEYLWSFGDGTTSTEAEPEVSYSTAASYTIELEVSYTGVAGCTSVESQTVSVTTATVPQITATSTEICPGDPVTLSLAGTFNTITWSTGESSAEITIDEPDSYSVTTVDNNGCESGDQIEIVSKDVPVIEVTADKISVNPGEQVQLTATGADFYSWIPAELLNDATISNPVATLQTTTKFVATGTVTGGCSSKDSIVVQVTESNELNISPRKVFSPDSDINPTWVLDDNIVSYSSCILTVFDERGVKVYEKDNYNNDWDGTYDGNPLPEGVYYYVFGCPEGGKKMGTVLLVRK